MDLYTVWLGVVMSNAPDSIVIVPGDGGVIEQRREVPLSDGEDRPIQNEQHRSGLFFLFLAVEALVLLILL